MASKQPNLGILPRWATLPALFCAAVLLEAAGGQPSTKPEHIRGTIESLDGDVLKVATSTGSVRVGLGPSTSCVGAQGDPPALADGACAPGHRAARGDLALRFNPPESGDLRARRLTPIGFALYASSDYLARHPRPAPGAGFAGHDAVLFEEGFRGSPAFASLVHSLHDARAAVRANSMLSMVEAVATGLGWERSPAAWAMRIPGCGASSPSCPRNA